MLAVSLGNEVLVRGLLAAKADPSAADSEGMTAKDWAEKHNRPELIELLELPNAGS
jgi:ankyrin repeat protein